MAGAEPLTGRTHQLRVHTAGEGWPILGDPIYGTRRARRADAASSCAGDRRADLQEPGAGEGGGTRAGAHAARGLRRPKPVIARSLATRHAAGRIFPPASTPAPIMSRKTMTSSGSAPARGALSNRTGEKPGTSVPCRPSRSARDGFCRHVVKMTVRADWPCARSLRARSFTTSGKRRHAGCGRARARREGENMQEASGRTRRPVSSERSNIASVSVGKSGDDVGAERRCPAARAAQLAQKAIASARRWRRFMRFRIMSSPDCSDR